MTLLIVLSTVFVGGPVGESSKDLKDLYTTFLTESAWAKILYLLTPAKLEISSTLRICLKTLKSSIIPSKY